MTSGANYPDILSACIVIPCYNEARRLDLAKFRQFLSTQRSIRLIFVDDGSRDHTVQILKELCSGFEQSTYILAQKRNSGKGEAVRAGLMHALGETDIESVGFWDADLATPLETIPRFIDILRIQSEIDMVFGARVQLLGRNVHRKATRHYLGRVFATAVSAVLELPIYDTQCGAKLFRVTPDTKAIFRDPFLSRWVFDVEIIARYQAFYRERGIQLANTIYEYPLETWIDVEGSKVHAGDFLKAFWDIVRIRQKYLR
jgi:dolichyl-phosphate beta-glucosyltransferase